MYINHSVWLSFQYILAVIIGLFGSKICLRLNLILMDLVTSLIKKTKVSFIVQLPLYREDSNELLLSG